VEERVCAQVDKRTLGEVIEGADIFLACRRGRAEIGHGQTDGARPDLALANPNPEIEPEEARSSP
jgi:malate dehydrogenase (oxaloacetate-decarboxylating)(NADP+)